MKTKFGLQKQRPNTVLLFCGIMCNKSINTLEIEQHLVDLFGPLHERSTSIHFSEFTNYYEYEMGTNLYKYLVSFQNLQLLEDLYKIKLKTVELEMLYSKNEKRVYNIDPGYLSLGKTNMFTTKDFVHRTYIKDGIFGEVNLMYSNKSKTYEPCFGTYPDFQTSIFRDFLNKERGFYTKQLNKIH